MTATALPNKRQALIWRGIGFTLAWLVVAGPAPAGWLLGLPTVALATWVSLRLAPPLPYRVDLWGLLSLLGYFVRESLRGGWDVAIRTLSPRMRIRPGQACYYCSLPDGLPMVLFAGCVSLLPGTLSQRFDGGQLSLHLLDEGEPQEAQLRQLEVRIARMFGIQQEASHD